MNMFDEARALRTMINMCNMTQSEIAKRMGVSQSYVANKIRLLGFSEHMQELILDANLSERHARTLLKLKDEALVCLAIQKIKSMGLNVSASEALIDGMIVDNMPKKLVDNSARDRVNKFEDMISAAVKNLLSCGLKVKQKTDYSGGKKYITVCIEE